jgi:hypothetical protein
MLNSSFTSPNRGSKYKQSASIDLNRTEVALLNDLDRTNWELIRELVIQHHDGNVRCESCNRTPNPDNRSTCLRSAIFYTQKPSSVIFYDGLDPNHPMSAMVDAHTPKAFQVTTPLILPYAPGAEISPRSPFAAFAYAHDHLGADQCFVFGSSDAPMAREIVDHWETANRSNSEDPRLKETKPIYDSARATATNLGKTSPKDLYHLVGLELLRWNSMHLQHIPNHEMRVTAAFLNRQESRLTAFTPQDSLMDLFEGRAGAFQNIPTLQKERKPHLAYCCLCCDSRAADGSRVFGRERVLHSHSISVLIPPYDPADLTWRGILRAMKQGVPLTIVMGHSKCGGIQALVDMERARRQGGQKSLGRFIDPWLAQAAPIVSGVFSHINENPEIYRGISDEDLCGLVARRVKMWSALNACAGTGKPAVACFQDLDKHIIEFLPANDSIEKTYERMILPERKLYLPSNLRQSDAPRECPVSKNVIPDRPYAWLLNVSSDLSSAAARL